MAHNIPTQWEVPQFSFNTEDQASEWKKFHIQALHYLEALDIDQERQDETKKGWQQIRMMFKGEDRYILQTLLNNNTITDEDQLTPACTLQAIQTTIKEDEHHWHYRDEIFSNIRQQPDEGIHTLNTRITNLVNNCKFTDTATTETIKIMLLVHSVIFHETRDWIRLQDQSALMYQSLLQHCKLLEQ